MIIQAKGLDKTLVLQGIHKICIKLKNQNWVSHKSWIADCSLNNPHYYQYKFSTVELQWNLLVADPLLLWSQNERSEIGCSSVIWEHFSHFNCDQKCYISNSGEIKNALAWTSHRVWKCNLSYPWPLTCTIVWNMTKGIAL